MQKLQRLTRVSRIPLQQKSNEPQDKAFEHQNKEGIGLKLFANLFARQSSVKGGTSALSTYLHNAGIHQDPFEPLLKLKEQRRAIMA